MSYEFAGGLFVTKREDPLFSITVDLKKCEIMLQPQLITRRKSYIGFRFAVQFSQPQLFSVFC